MLSTYSSQNFSKKKRLWPWVLFLVLVAFILGVYQGSQWFFKLNQIGCFPLSEDIKPIQLKLADPKNARFVILGDTANYVPEKDNPFPLQIVQSIQRLCAQQPCDFAVFLGDNFRYDGIQSSTDPNLQYFESIYQRLNMPLIGVLGNHDVNRGNALAQVLYSYKNPWWHMPNYNYQFEAGHVKFTAINTNCSSLAWWRLKDQPKKPKTGWAFLMAHHPIYSNGIHGDVAFYNRWLWQALGEPRFDAYLAGHNHTLQASQKGANGSLHVVSGAVYGVEADRTTTETKETSAKVLFKNPGHGFAIADASAELLTITFYNEQAERLISLEKPKSGPIKTLP